MSKSILPDPFFMQKSENTGTNENNTSSTGTSNKMDTSRWWGRLRDIAESLKKSSENHPDINATAWLFNSQYNKCVLLNVENAWYRFDVYPDYYEDVYSMPVNLDKCTISRVHNPEVVKKHSFETNENSTELICDTLIQWHGGCLEAYIGEIVERIFLHHEKYNNVITTRNDKKFNPLEVLELSQKIWEIVKPREPMNEFDVKDYIEGLFGKGNRNPECFGHSEKYFVETKNDIEETYSKSSNIMYITVAKEDKDGNFYQLQISFIRSGMYDDVRNKISASCEDIDYCDIYFLSECDNATEADLEKIVLKWEEYVKNRIKHKEAKNYKEFALHPRRRRACDITQK